MTTSRLATGVCFLLFAVAGCISGGSGGSIDDGPRGDGLSGGSVPRGGEVDVQVVQVDPGAQASARTASLAEDRALLNEQAWSTVTGAVVRIQDSRGGIHHPYSVLDGHYDFLGIPEGAARMIVRPPDGVAGLTARQVDINITPDKPAALVVWLGEDAPNARVDTIDISPSTATVAPNESVSFVVNVEGSDVESLLPVWTFHGVGGEIAPDGTFTANEVGIGVVIVTVGDQSVNAVVIIDDSIRELMDETPNGQVNRYTP